MHVNVSWCFITLGIYDMNKLNGQKNAKCYNENRKTVDIANKIVKTVLYSLANKTVNVLSSHLQFR